MSTRYSRMPKLDLIGKHYVVSTTSTRWPSGCSSASQGLRWTISAPWPVVVLRARFVPQEPMHIAT
jgi:hypothetical protein